MIPFWPPMGLGPRGLIDHVIRMGGRDGPCTPTIEDEVEQCMEALRRREAMMEESEEFAGVTYRGAI